MKNKILKNISLYAIGLLILILIYFIASIIKNDSYFLPGIDLIFKSFIELIITSNTYISLLKTLLNVLISLIIAFIFAIIFASIAYRFNKLYLILKPLMSILRSIPIIIIINVIWYLLMMENKQLVLYFSVFSVLFPIIYEAIYQALNAIDKSYIDVYKINSNLTFYIIIRVYIPLVFESFKSSLINSIGLGLKIALSVEFICSIKDTLGYYINRELKGYDGFSKTYAYLIILIIVMLILEIIPYIIGYFYKKYQKKMTLKKIEELELD